MRNTRIWALCCLLVLPVAAEAKTSLRHVPLSPEIGPFPSDVLTVTDSLQKTGRHVELLAVADAAMPVWAPTSSSCDRRQGADQSVGWVQRQTAVQHLLSPDRWIPTR